MYGMMEHDQAFASDSELLVWNKLGTPVGQLRSTAQALDDAGLNWTVELEPTHRPNGKVVPGRFNTVRTDIDHVFDVVGKDYKVIQNTDAFAFMDHMFDTDGNYVSAAGSLFNGAQVFIVAKIGDTFTVANGDEHDSYLLITTSHTGKGAFNAAITTVRLSCTNMVNVALKNASSRWSMTHRSSLEGRANEAMHALGLVHKYEDAFQAEVEELLKIDVTKDRFLDIVTGLLPQQPRQLPKNLAELEAIWESEPTNPEGDNAWRALNSLTFWNDHKDYRTDDAAYKYLTTGPGAAMRNQMHERLLTLA
jgi:phage/plasmid-like protein (TIGR03299 family)